MVGAISPEQFFRAYSEAVREENELIQGSYDSPRDYTKIVRSSVLPRVAERISLEVFVSDYYTLDAIFYGGRDEDRLSKYGTYAKSILIAFEHENVVGTSMIEMNKLQMFNSPLKVLVTYASSGREQKKWLGIYEKIIKSADTFGDISSLRRQLVIFGERGVNAPRWRGYQFESGGFEEIL
jgi:hypothetical protein